MTAIRSEGEGGRGEDCYADGPGEVRKGSEEAEEEDQEEKAREHRGIFSLVRALLRACVAAVPL